MVDMRSIYGARWDPDLRLDTVQDEDPDLISGPRSKSGSESRQSKILKRFKHGRKRSEFTNVVGGLRFQIVYRQSRVSLEEVEMSPGRSSGKLVFGFVVGCTVI